MYNLSPFYSTITHAKMAFNLIRQCSHILMDLKTCVIYHSLKILV